MTATGHYHFSVKAHGRGIAGKASYRSGSRIQGGIVARAAYRSGERLFEQETGVTYDYGKRAHSVDETLILAPEGAPEWAQDRAAVERGRSSLLSQERATGERV
jgi:hypothetical protein